MDKNKVYYSHVNEDNRIERDLLKKSDCNTVVAVCGSGERVLSLMDLRHCKHLIVVDINPCALFLLQLKIIALTHLSVQVYLQFIGHDDLAAKERMRLYKLLRKHLPDEARDFWDDHPQDVSNGILFSGQFEKFLSRIRPMVKWFLGNGIRGIFQATTTSHLPKIRWKILLKLFSYKFIYQLAGNKDIAFTGKNASLAQISKALAGLITSGKAPDSFITHLIFKGSLKQMPASELPPSLQPEVLSAIKAKLMNAEIKINYHVNDFTVFLKDVLPKLPQTTFYSISDLLSYVDFIYLRDIVSKVKSTGSIIVGRSFVRNRLSVMELTAMSDYGKVKILDNKESTLMYQVFSFKPVP